MPHSVSPDPSPADDTSLPDAPPSEDQVMEDANNSPREPAAADSELDKKTTDVRLEELFANDTDDDDEFASSPPAASRQTGESSPPASEPMYILIQRG
jgi:DNA primase small subunit